VEVIVANTLAYSRTESIAAVKSFMVHTSGLEHVFEGPTPLTIIQKR
jgi:hypothetical protein